MLRRTPPCCWHGCAQASARRDFRETFARPVDSLLTVLVIESHGTRLDRSRTDPRMMMPAGRASGFNDNLCNCQVCRVSLAFHLDTVVMCFELPERCSGY